MKLRGDYALAVAHAKEQMAAAKAATDLVAANRELRQERWWSGRADGLEAAIELLGGKVE